MIRRGFGILALVAGLALTGCASEDWELRYNELHGEMIDVVADRDLQRQQLADVLARQDSLEQQSLVRERELSQLRQDANQSTDRAKQYADRVAELEDEIVAIQDQRVDVAAEETNLLAQHVQRLRLQGFTDAQINNDGDLEIPISSDITFGAGKADLTKKGQSAVRSLTGDLTGTFADYDIRIEGHTDNVPLNHSRKLWGDNVNLGRQRALAVVRFMETSLDIDSSRLMSVSHGERQPVASNDTKAGRARNRRVAIVVVRPHGTDVQAK